MRILHLLTIVRTLSFFGRPRTGLETVSHTSYLLCLSDQIESLQAASAGSTNVFAPSDTPTINDVPAEEKDVNVELVEGNPEGGKEEAGDEKFLEEVSTSREEEDFGEFVASETATTVSAAVKPLLVWMRRKEAVIYNLVSHHLHQKQFVVALQWLNRLLARTPTDGNLLSKVGYVQLQLGDIEGAQLTFSKVEALLSDPPSDTLLINLVGRNRGLLHFAEKQYSKAFDEFNAVLGRDPTDAVSANNKVGAWTGLHTVGTNSLLWGLL